MKDHVEAARKVLAGLALPKAVYHSILRGENSGRYDDAFYGDCVEALDRAGLLRTGLEGGAIAACEGYAQIRPHQIGEPTAIAVRRVGLGPRCALSAEPERSAPPPERTPPEAGTLSPGGGPEGGNDAD